MWINGSIRIEALTVTCIYGASSIETRHLAKIFNFLFISKIYSTISIRCISSIFQKIARCRVSIDEAPYDGVYDLRMLPKVTCVREKAYTNLIKNVYMAFFLKNI